jgi:hypothetical protein
VTARPPAADLPQIEPRLPRFAALLAMLALGGAIAAWVAWPIRQSVADGSAAFDAGPGSIDATGGMLFVREGCGACHATVGPSSAMGPTLAGAAESAAQRIASPEYAGFAESPDAYLREATLDHCVDVPAEYDYACDQLSEVGLRLSSDEIDRLVQFMVDLPTGVAR